MLGTRDIPSNYLVLHEFERTLAIGEEFTYADLVAELDASSKNHPEGLWIQTQGFASGETEYASITNTNQDLSVSRGENVTSFSQIQIHKLNLPTFKIRAKVAGVLLYFKVYG
jgi:hypothetical protein